MEPSPPKADRVSFRTEPSANCTCSTPRDALLEAWSIANAGQLAKRKFACFFRAGSAPHHNILCLHPNPTPISAISLTTPKPPQSPPRTPFPAPPILPTTTFSVAFPSPNHDIPRRPPPTCWSIGRLRPATGPWGEAPGGEGILPSPSAERRIGSKANQVMRACRRVRGQDALAPRCLAPGARRNSPWRPSQGKQNTSPPTTAPPPPCALLAAPERVRLTLQITQGNAVTVRHLAHAISPFPRLNSHPVSLKW